MSDNSAIEWRPVPTHDGYFANALGQIKGPSELVLKPMRTETGHLYVLTPLPRRPRKLFVHRAVLLAFVGPQAEGQECRHLDGAPDNNHLDNLRWGTRLENMHDKARHGTEHQGEDKPQARLTVAQVHAILRDARSSRVVGREYGVSHTAVQRIRRNERWRVARQYPQPRTEAVSA